MSELLQYILSLGGDFRRARLPSLYSDFSLIRSSNPDGFAANVTAWQNALRQAAKAGLIPAPDSTHDTLSLRTGEELLQALSTKEWGRPLSLATVIDDAVERRYIIPLREFLDTPTSIYCRKWSIRPWWLVSWGLQQLGLYEKHAVLGKLPSARYVVVPNVEEASDQIISRIGNRTNIVDRIIPRKTLAQEATKAMGLQENITDSDLTVVLIYLARDKGVLVYDDMAVKLKSPNEPLSPLNTQDRTIASLKSLIADLSIQTTALTSRISDLSQKAQIAVKTKNRISALAALRSKKAAETTLSQRFETLNQLEEVYSKIEQAADQAAVIRVMEASTGVLRGLNSQTGSVEKVEDVVEGLRDEISKVSEIGQVMEEAGRGETIVDADELDQELEDLERQERAVREEKEAEQTRKRLAELDAVQKQESAEQSEERQQDADVAADTKALRRLSLQDSLNGDGTKAAVMTKEALPADG